MMPCRVRVRRLERCRIRRVVPVDLSAHEVPQVLLDVREAPEREESVKHEGSLHVPLSQLSDTAGSYCRQPTCPQSC